jgi:heterodisulfide reductase subunit A-like polyferredoxin
MLASSGYLCRIERELCRGCGICEDTCQFFAIQILEGKAVVDENACYGCGVCVDQCEFGAAELVRSMEKGVPLEIRSLLETAWKQEAADVEYQ